MTSYKKGGSMAKKNKFDYDLIVVGSGASGSTAAIRANHAGEKVAIVEKGMFGGSAPNWSDVPVHALLNTAHTLLQAKEAQKFGIRSQVLSYSFPSVMQYKDLVIKRTGAAGNRKYYENQGIDAYHAAAHFLSPNEISVGKKRISASNFIIATGSTWKKPDYYGVEYVDIKTPDNILDTKQLPKELCIVGANSTALEYASIFSALGTKVTLLESSARLLPNEDEEVGRTLEYTLEKFHKVHVKTESKVLSVEKKSGKIKLIYSRGGQEHPLSIDTVLSTEHHTPSTDLGLENANVNYDQKGIEVNETLTTTNSNIYSCGSVLDPEMPANIALLQGRTAVHNLLNRQKNTVDKKGAPKVTHTYPAVASVGMSEDDCLKQDLKIKQSLVSLGVVTKSNTTDYREGFVKLIANQKNVILGAVIVAPQAAEMIHELTLAVRHELTAEDLATTPHAFLSWSEAIRIAALRICQK